MNDAWWTPTQIIAFSDPFVQPTNIPGQAQRVERIAAISFIQSLNTIVPVEWRERRGGDSQFQ